MFQTTIARESCVEGVGLHTGVHGFVRLMPAPAETGIVFRRVDLDNFHIEAQGHNVAHVSYATSLMKQGVLLSTTEHLLAAIYSCGIDNVYIDINSIEIPILDGSAEPFMQMLEHSGVRKLRRKRRYLKVLKPLEVCEGDRRIGIYPADEFRVRCYVDFPHPLVGQQEVEMLVGPDTFRQLLARARTFCFERDIAPLRAMGLIRGGSLDNAIVLTKDGVMNGPLRYPDEFGRHKALDLIGDLALVGLPLLGRVEARKAGHSLHTQPKRGRWQRQTGIHASFLPPSFHGSLTRAPARIPGGMSSPCASISSSTIAWIASMVSVEPALGSSMTAW